ncbi:MAG: hypothetical protein JW944_05925 [Deltaproteobacteria bacterium]|nr:hypothetical protein [Deltaproteobacteria bacterium]
MIVPEQQSLHDNLIIRIGDLCLGLQYLSATYRPVVSRDYYLSFCVIL